MTARATILHRLSLAAWLLLAAVAAPQSTSRAQDDDEDDPPAIAAPRQPLYLVNEALFNRAVFNNMPVEKVRERFASLLALKIADVDRRCGLSEAQKGKLELAGRGDLKRLFDRIEDRKDILGKHLEQDQYVKLMQELRPLQVTLVEDPFGDGSIFFKALKTTLDEEQAAQYGEVERERLRQRHRNTVERLIATLDRSLALSLDQRRRLASLLLEETRPPRIFGTYDTYVVLYQMARLPEAKVRPIFDDQQWLTLGRRFDQANAMAQVLRSGNYLPDDAGVEKHEQD